VVTLALTAQDLAFTPTSLLGVRAGARFRIAFTNRDATVDHSVGIRNAGGAQVFDPGTPVTGIASITYSIPALVAGTYTYYCTVHSFMTGTITVH
jgi:plastocyanin